MQPPPDNATIAPIENGNGHKPLVAITMGDPGGVGAEVIVKALADPEIRKLGRFIVYGLEEMLLYAAGQAEIAPLIFERQAFVIDSQQVEHSGPQVINRGRVFDDVITQFVGRTVDAASLNPASRHPDAETERVVVATIAPL